MELIIKGDSRRIKILEKELRLRAKKNGFEMSLKDVKDIEVKAKKVKAKQTDNKKKSSN